jgi:hypothetical protein
MSLSQQMSSIELSAPTLSPETMRLIQLALYYDFVLFNMQEKPFRVLLVSGGGAIGNKERGTMMTIPNPGQPSLFVEFNPVKELHDALVDCLTDKKKCNDENLRDNVDYLKETLYVPSKIAEFKERGQTTPAELYDLLNPGDGDINTAIQNAVSKIKAIATPSTVPYLGDAVLTLISNGAAAQFLDAETVAAMRSIMANANQGGRTRRRRRGAQRRGTKRHNRRSYKNKKRTRRH